MKRISFIFLLIFFLIFFFSCKHSSENETVKVLLESIDTTTEYEFIDQEGEVYKSGKVFADEIITINHFKKGTYNLRYTNIHNQTSYVRKIVNIQKQCKISFYRNDFKLH